MRLIVNGDDFGYSAGQNYGIIDAFTNGVLRSTSLMVTGKAVAHALDLARQHPGLGIGLHLVVDYGRPLSPPAAIPSLVGPDGIFLRPNFEGPLDLAAAEVAREWRAQILWCREHGLELTHLDSHHHFHLHPQLIAVTAALAREFELPIRTIPVGWSTAAAAKLAGVRRPDACLVDFYAAGVREEFFTNLLLARPEHRGQTIEVMCHPAYLDDFLLTNSSYNLARVDGIDVLS